MALLTFQLEYHTTWGQEVCLCGSIPQLGNLNETEALVLQNDGDTWYTELTVPASTDLSYYYFIRERNSTVRKEWGALRSVRIVASKDFIFKDLWKNQPYHTYLYSSAFSDSIFYHDIKPIAYRYHAHSILLHVICPYVSREQTLVISGSSPELGEWELPRAKPLRYINKGEWQILLDAKRLPEKSQYKFVIVDKTSGLAVHWEEGGNRILDNHKTSSNASSVYAEMGLVYHHHHFTYKGVGTAIPVFSLKSNQSFGIGDFADLRMMVDWAVETGQQIIQLLPVNDTTNTKTWQDSYPYSAISNFALHPLYLGCAEFSIKNKRINSRFLREAEQLNKLPLMDYEKVLSLKNRYTRALFEQEGEKVLETAEFKSFYLENESWLFPYACYCFLRDKNGNTQFETWGRYSKFDEASVRKMVESAPEVENEIHYWSFVQFILHRQFSKAKSYAHQKGVTLKGDIPIGISRNSVDAWTSPHLFNMDTQTGAPPDDFSLFGQNWGFPTYNWQAMEEEGYDWWISRFQKMADYFDAYRIDHILGFFRIWEIPLDAVQGLLGYFNPALPYWSEEIRQAGIPFDEQRMVQPYIHESFLEEIFGPDVEQVKEKYLQELGWERYQLKPVCNTQQKISKLFEKKNDIDVLRVRDGLLLLCNEVLFVRDPHDQSRFHPRITGQYTYSYHHLEHSVKEAYNHLYDDFFYRRHNYFWREQAMKKLPTLLSATSMLACGEDLGMVPDCVPSVMKELQILSLEIERMPKDARHTFADLQRLPYLSVCTTSTHDMSPLRLWWTENRNLTQQYYNQVLHREGVAPEVCPPEIAYQIIKRHLHSSAMWVILPWQDWMAIDHQLQNPDIESERINIPANPQHYWRYRMHLTLEDLLNETQFNEQVKKLARRS